MATGAPSQTSTIPYHDIPHNRPRFVREIPMLLKKLTTLMTLRYTDEPELPNMAIKVSSKHTHPLSLSLSAGLFFFSCSLYTHAQTCTRTLPACFSVCPAAFIIAPVFDHCYSAEVNLHTRHCVYVLPPLPPLLSSVCCCCSSLYLYCGTCWAHKRF